MWVNIIEKAYAKLHGHYYLLKSISVNDALIDLTGCPVTYIDFDDDDIIKKINNNELWNDLIN